MKIRKGLSSFTALTLSALLLFVSFAFFSCDEISSEGLDVQEVSKSMVLDFDEYCKDKKIDTSTDFLPEAVGRIGMLFEEYETIVFSLDTVTKRFLSGKDVGGITVSGEKVSIDTRATNGNTLYVCFLKYIVNVLPEESRYWWDEGYLPTYSRIPIYELVVSTEHNKKGYSSAEEYYNAMVDALKNKDISVLPSDIYFITFDDIYVLRGDDIEKINLFKPYLYN